MCHVCHNMTNELLPLPIHNEIVADCCPKHATIFHCEVLPLALVLMSQVLEEWYPLSHFPMYRALDPKADYLFISDGRDRPVALNPVFGTSGGFLKKLYFRQLEEFQGNSSAAAQATLRGLVPRNAQSEVPATLKLHHVNVIVRPNGVTHERSELGSWTR